MPNLQRNRGDHRRLIKPMSGPCYVGSLRCWGCSGQGKRGKYLEEWAEHGEELRRDRLSRDMSLREEAKRRGMTPRELGDMEHGRVQPVKAEE